MLVPKSLEYLQVEVSRLGSDLVNSRGIPLVELVRKLCSGLDMFTFGGVVSTSTVRLLLLVSPSPSTISTVKVWLLSLPVTVLVKSSVSSTVKLCLFVPSIFRLTVGFSPGLLSSSVLFTSTCISVLPCSLLVTGFSIVNSGLVSCKVSDIVVVAVTPALSVAVNSAVISP